MKRISGLKLLDEREGEGRLAKKCDLVVYNTRIFLNQGDEVPLNELQEKHVHQDMLRVEGGITFFGHKTLLGSRQTMAGVEHALMGMKVGGYRKVRVSPHLAYRDEGIPDLIPPDAVLICEVWLRNIVGSSSVESLSGVT